MPWLPNDSCWAASTRTPGCTCQRVSGRCSSRCCRRFRRESVFQKEQLEAATRALESPCLTIRRKVMDEPESRRLSRSRRIQQGLALLLLVGVGTWRSHLGTRLDSFHGRRALAHRRRGGVCRSGDYRLNPEHPRRRLWVGQAMPASFELHPVAVLKGEGPGAQVGRGDDVPRQRFTARPGGLAPVMWALHGLLLFLLGRCCGAPEDGFGRPARSPFCDRADCRSLPSCRHDRSAVALLLTIAVVTAGLLVARWEWRAGRSPAASPWGSPSGRSTRRSPVSVGSSAPCC